MANKDINLYGQSQNRLPKLQEELDKIERGRLSKKQIVPGSGSFDHEKWVNCELEALENRVSDLESVVSIDEDIHYED